MSPDPRSGSSVRQRRDGRFRPSRRRSVQWPMVLWLTVVWAFLWGSWSLFVLLSGALVAVLASVVFPLPPLRMRLRIRPVGVVILGVRFVLDVILASLEVAWIVLRPRADLTSAMVKVPLRTESDLVLTAVGVMVTLVPGSVVVEAHRSSHTLYLHALGVRGDDDLDRIRRAVWAQEERILAAFGEQRIEEVGRDDEPGADAEGEADADRVSDPRTDPEVAP